MKFKISFCFFSVRAYTLIDMYARNFKNAFLEYKFTIATIILQFQRNAFLLDISIIFGIKIEANEIDEIDDEKDSFHFRNFIV